MDNNIEKITLFIDAITSSTSSTGYLIRQSNRTWGEFPESDFYVPLVLDKREEVIDYASVSRQQGFDIIDRQNFNPFFIEYDFFTTIQRNKIINSTNLSIAQIAFIRESRPDVNNDFPTDDGVRNWFDEFGLNELPWNPGTSNEVTLNTLEEVTINLQNIVSKASIYPIDINN